MSCPSGSGEPPCSSITSAAQGSAAVQRCTPVHVTALHGLRRTQANACELGPKLRPLDEAGSIPALGRSVSYEILPAAEPRRYSSHINAIRPPGTAKPLPRRGPHSQAVTARNVFRSRAGLALSWLAVRGEEVRRVTGKAGRAFSPRSEVNAV
jgi:hypothetical protein